jgi:hypothetical protein
MAEPVPDFFSDTFDFTFTPYGMVFAFGARPVRAGPGELAAPVDRAVVRMSLEQAKILAMLLRRELNRYERASGVSIGLPNEVYEQLDLNPDDWHLAP